jgi:hypothetical protein
LKCEKQLANESRVSMGLWYNGNICRVLKFEYKRDQTGELTIWGWHVNTLHIKLVQIDKTDLCTESTEFYCHSLLLVFRDYRVV